MSHILLNNIDLWTSAIRHKSTAGRGSNRKIELAGINKLRELILELAVRGKLVPQNPDDEPASELLKRIEAEKAQLVKDGKLKKQKPLPPVTDEEKPFELPQGWEWVKLGVIQIFTNGFAFKSQDLSDTPSDYGVVKIGDVYRSGEIKEDKMQFIRADIAKGIEEKFFIEPGDLVITMTGDVKIAFNTSEKRYLLNQRVGKIEPILVNSRYICLPLILVSDQKIKEASGGVIPNVSTEEINATEFPLPPLAEQQRIVAKVDELMALCDQLEQQSEHQLDAHQQLTETLLSTLLTPAAGALTNATSAQELSDNWQRLAQHFDLLFSGPMGAWAIDRLKDTILQLAVMGKLVPQNPDDEPASELLKRIDAEKARLVKEGKIKKQKTLPPVSDDEKPFELPEGWSISRLGKLANFQKGHAFKSSEYINTGLMICKIQNLTENSANGCVYISPEKYNLFKKYVLNENDIVMTTVGSWFSAPLSAVGRSFLVGKLFHNSLLNQNAVRIRPYEGLENSYVFMCMNTPTFKTYMEKEAQGTANQASLTQESIQNFIVYTPPLAEQHRIVAKVDELFALCDQLKERLQQASDTQLNLTDAIVEQALN